ncbi:hypothetical protein HRbin27_01653 [bacterium HR27]|nr:hypothetical protein HRbin27_01653 [bacterium HR27]
MEDGVEGLLKVDALAQAVGGDEEPPRCLAELAHALASLFLADPSGEAGDLEVGEVGPERSVKPLGDVLGGLDEDAPDDRCRTPSEELADGSETRLELAVVRRILLDGASTDGQVAQPAPVFVGERERPVGGEREPVGRHLVERWLLARFQTEEFGRLGAVGLGFLGEYRELALLLAGEFAAFERLGAGTRAGHDAAEEREGSPPLEAALAFGQRTATLDEFSAESEGVLEERLVGCGELVRRLLCLPLRVELHRFLPLLADIGSGALDEVAGEPLALVALELVEVPLLEVAVEQAEQALEGALDTRVRGGGEQDEVAARVAHQFGDELVAEVPRVALGGRRRDDAVCFVDDDQIGRLGEERLAVAGELEEVDRGDDDRVVAIDRATGRERALERRERGWADDDRLQVELLAELGRPLVSERWWAEDDEAADRATVPELAGDETGLDRLADADVVGDEEAHRVESQCHEERDELVGAGAHRDAAERAEGSSPLAQEQASGLTEQADSLGVGELSGVGEREAGRLDPLARKGVSEEIGELPVHGHRILARSGERAEEDEFVVAAGEDDPLAVAETDDRARLDGHTDLPSARPTVGSMVAGRDGCQGVTGHPIGGSASRVALPGKASVECPARMRTTRIEET